MLKTVDGPGRAGNLLPALAALACVLFGIAMTLNIHPIGDGLWYWYAVAVRHGQHLYSDLHLNLEPFFVLFTAAGQRAFGMGWLVGKIVPVIQLICYCVALFLISKRLRWRPLQTSVLLLAVFSFTIATQFYRFDDYHITTHSFEVYSIYLLLLLDESSAEYAGPVLGVLLGILTGWSTGNRLNDGAALFGAVIVALPFFARRQRVLSVVAYVLATTASLLLLIRATGDTIAVWANETIFLAAKIKGGSGNMMGAPLKFPLKSIHGLMHFSNMRALLIAASAALILSAYRVRRFRVLYGLAAIFLLFSFRNWKASLSWNGTNIMVATLAIPLIYGLAFYVLWRLIQVLRGRAPEHWSRHELLLFIPMLQLLAGTITAGKSLPQFTPAVGMVCLLAPISLPWTLRLREGWIRRLFVGLMGFVAISGFASKYVHPYYWHHFDDTTMFHNRTWYHHPTLGAMYIEKPQLAVMLPMCSLIQHSDTPDQLLSLPYPYPNYFCGVAPWHGYVQTWYDTSSKPMIDALISQLQSAPPPAWIAYQRALNTMAIHETVFRGGQPLPHRALDNLIVQKIQRGEWSIAFQSCYLGADWVLIRTSPAPAGTAFQSLLPQTDERDCEDIQKPKAKGH